VPVEASLLDLLRATYWHHVEHVSTVDISAWLIRQAAHCDALSLRDTGGVYFIPRHALDNWRTRADALHGASRCRVLLIPAMNGEEALEAAVQALLDECSAFSAALEQELEADTLGARALETRGGQAKRLLEKLTRYETLFGKVAQEVLSDVRTQIETQQANAVHMALLKGDGQ